MTRPRRIAVVTGSRAEYGLLYWIMKRLADDERAELQLVVTGAHLSPAFGRTVEAIRGDGFTIAAEVDMLVDGDTNWATASALGLGVIGLAGAFRKLAPDVVVLLGDRYETLAAAQAAFMGRVPVAHIHGGEVTQGALDDGIRHAVTKLASLHFVSTEEHHRRVIQLGEQPARVRNVGAPGLESVARLKLGDRAHVEKRIGRSLTRPTILLTYHPATAADEEPVAGLEAILGAVAAFPQATVIATGSNADPGGRAIHARLAQAESEFGGRFMLAPSLGQIGYLSAMTCSDLVLGNSSSGIIEAPSVGVPTVNVGSRQDGRPRAASVIDCAPDSDAIAEAIRRALDPKLAAVARRRENPYASSGLDVSLSITETLLNTDLDALGAAKPFLDLSFEIPEMSR